MIAEQSLKFFSFPEILVLFALAFQAFGFAIRDGLWLRVFILIGTCFYLSYYTFKIEADPMWEAIFASGVLGIINLVMIVLLVFERTTFSMSEEMNYIYQSFPTLNPGQFRKVMSAGVTRFAKPGKVLVTDGAPLDRLILVTQGQVSIAKGKKKYHSDAKVFIGEVSFLRKGNASATVSVSKDAKYVEWRHEDLRRMMANSPAMNNALIALFGAELACKVENAMPVNIGADSNSTEE